MPLPLNIDANMMRNDLLRWGWNDYKIEVAIGASGGYMAKLRGGINMGYTMAARLYNLWEDESQKPNRVPAPIHALPHKRPPAPPAPPPKPPRPPRVIEAKPPKQPRIARIQSFVTTMASI